MRWGIDMKKIFVLFVVFMINMISICNAKQISVADNAMTIEFPDNYFIVTKAGIIQEGFLKGKNVQFYNSLQKNVFKSDPNREVFVLTPNKMIFINAEYHGDSLDMEALYENQLIRYESFSEVEKKEWEKQILQRFQNSNHLFGLFPKRASIYNANGYAFLWLYEVSETNRNREMNTFFIETANHFVSISFGSLDNNLDFYKPSRNRLAHYMEMSEIIHSITLTNLPKKAVPLYKF